MSDATSARPASGGGEVALFFALACGITWLLDLPMALACARHTAPPAYALPLGGLGAWGPTLAAVAVAARRREVRGVFGPWRASAVWIVAALALPAAMHLAANVAEVALGGRPAHWWYPPDAPERYAALVMFSLGEEFGWRGFAYPRMARLYGPVAGSLILGAVWGIWHLGMLFTPEKGLPDPLVVGRYVVELALFSVVLAWLLERNGRSLAVAIAFHAGGHLDNVTRAPEGETRLQALRLAVLVIAAALAARALRARRGEARAMDPSTG